ncbi:MAG: bifunctional metallophosphatase/5'-nucleotidase [Rhodocyclales bacterium]|nr:bifunctional metallophosphatase/5'-nucleotidase [Rhodocyclales bacterium]
MSLAVYLRRCALALFLSGLAALGLAQGRAAVVEIGIVHVNDIYQIAPVDAKAPRGGLARLAGLVETLRRAHPATLFVFGGDTLSPGIESGIFKGAQMMRAWNAMRLDFAVPGNHEFDFGPEVARERFAESRFPWLAANLVAEPPLPMVRASELRTVGGVRLGFVGLITPQTVTLSKPGPRIRFDALVDVARREAAALRAQGAEAVVALTHNDLAEDREIAASGAVDLILGGHEHHLITEMGGRTPIFKAGSDARDALHVRLRFAREGAGHRLLGLRWDILPVDGRWPEDAGVKAVAEDVERQVGARLGERIGETAVALDARGETLRRGESNIANFAVDAVRAALGADIALLNAGGFRSDNILGPGPITRRDVLALLPFQNPLLLLSITGAQLRDALEHGLDRRIVNGQSGALPHVSGLRIVYDPTRTRGQRIIELTANGQPLPDDARYRLATSNYLAGGGDGYAMLKGLPVLRAAEGSPLETEVLLQAMERAGTIAPQLDGRLRTLP